MKKILKCKTCEKCLQKMLGENIIGIICGITYENIYESTQVLPCEKETNNG